MATLWGIRQALIREFGVRTVAEAMLIDLAVLTYAMALRMNRMIGDAALTLEHQFFGDEEGPGVRFAKKHGREVAERLSVEHTIERLRLQLAPLLDRANRGASATCRRSGTCARHRPRRRWRSGGPIRSTWTASR